MARCPHGHEPTISDLLRRFYQEDGGSQFTLHLRSESSHCGGGGDDARMVVEVRMRLKVTFTVPSPEQGRSYLFEPQEKPEARFLVPIHGDPAQHFSSPDAAREILAPLFSSPLALRGRPGLHLGEVVSRFARAAATSAGITGEQGPIRVVADAEYLHVLPSHEGVDDIVDRCLRDLGRALDCESSTVLGICVVCLQEVEDEWLRTIQLPCLHIFHLHCISPWLQRNNSCPVCRRTVPLIEDDAREIESGFVLPPPV